MEAGKARVILLGLLFVVLFIVFSKSESRSVEHFEPVDDEQLVARGSELVLPPAPAPAPAPPPPAAVACQSCSERPLEDRDANPIWTWIQSYENGPGIHKYHQYLDSYHRHFAQYRSSKQDKIYMAEVGVQSGGSIEMWRNYFGADRLVYYGFDVNPKTKKFERDGVTITIGDQGKRSFWNEVKKTLPPLDIFIDDGGHTMTQQIVTFEEMFPHVKDGGVFLCEDTHTSYWLGQFGYGAYKKKGTWMEFVKDLLDSVNAYNSKELEKLKPDDNTKHIRGIHVYDSMVFFEKLATSPLETIKKGNSWMSYDGKEEDCKEVGKNGQCIK